MSKQLRQVKPDDEINNAPQNEANLGSQSCHQVYLNEDLTRRRRTIFTGMRSLKKMKKISDCWVYKSNLNLKTYHDEVVVRNVSRKVLVNYI